MWASGSTGCRTSIRCLQLDRLTKWSHPLQEVQYERCSFAIDVLECPECGGRLRLLATIAHPPTIAAILRHLGLPGEVPAPTPARQAEWWT
jgi:hypothetical protein